MKKLVALLVAVFVLASSPVCAADYAGMTDEELAAEANAIRNEQLRRELDSEDKTVLFDQLGVQVYLTGEYSLHSSYLELEAVVINDSDATINMHCSIDQSVSVNGWQCYCGPITAVPSGKRKRGTFMIDLSASDATTYEDVKEVEFALRCVDANSYQTLSTGDPVVAFLN